MRITVIILALAAAACATAVGAQAPAPTPAAPAAPPALVFAPTIYGDGASCPGGCDAHVVFAPQHNGTRNAFAPPLANRTAPQRCVNGEPCMICFDDADASCIEALYRGAGPPAQRFDFTAAFFAERCSAPDLPIALQRKCASFSATAARYLGADGIYCVAQPEHPLCAERIAAAEAERQADRAPYEACRADPAAFNASQPSTATRRAHQCTYSHELTGGPNSRGVRWRRLMPAACPAGSYVGRDGLDCCDRNAMTSLGGYGRECAIFVARPAPPTP